MEAGGTDVPMLEGRSLTLCALALSITLGACEPGILDGEPRPAPQGRDASVPPSSTNDASAPGLEPDAAPIEEEPIDAGASIDAGVPGDDEDGGPPVVVTPDAGPTRASVFVAQGYVGRTAISCDDGRSWIADQNLDASVRCNSIDCDHRSDRAMGLTYDGDRFVATWGWGAAGSVRRSEDALTWETTMTGPTFGGVVSGDGIVLLGSREPRMSSDGARTWQSAGTPSLTQWNVRRVGFADVAGGRFLLVVEDSRMSELAVSDGSGAWWRPSTFPAACGQAIMNDGGIGTVGGTIVIVGGDGVACRSTDAGMTWTSTSIGTSISSRVVEADGELWVWGGGRRFSTTDGARWESTPLVPAGLSVGAVGRSPDGTVVAVNGGWDQWYDRQRFYRSEDGVRFTELDPARYTRGHPIHAIVHGEVDASVCAGR